MQVPFRKLILASLLCSQYTVKLSSGFETRLAGGDDGHFRQQIPASPLCSRYVVELLSGFETRLDFRDADFVLFKAYFHIDHRL